MAILIKDIKAWQIIDSRGNPTVCACVELNNGISAIQSVPSGASVGINEAIELRDNNPDFLFSKSVLKAVDNVNNIIAPLLINKSPFNQFEIDNIMIEKDNTKNLSSLGANAILAVSLSVCAAASKALGLELFQYLGGINALNMPTPFINILNGGVHANNNLDFQEFMIVPYGAKSFSDALRISLEIFNTLKNILKSRNLSVNVGDEGGFAPELKTNKEALEVILDAIFEAGYSTDNVKIALDIAASEFYKDGKYNFENKSLTSDEMIDYLKNLCEDYPIISIEDGLAQDDFLSWLKLTQILNKKVMLVGDDLFTTNPALLKNGIENNAANSILIKLNQIGTLSKTLECIDLAKRNNYRTIISHRSGETESTFISDLAVGVNSGFIKTGSLSRSERTMKYNRLLYIEKILGNGARYLGMEYFN